MSITITCQFQHPYEARQAAERLRRRGYIVSAKGEKHSIPQDPLLVAYPNGAFGGNSSGNSLMAALPPMAGNGILLHTPAPKEQSMISVLTDDTQVSDARLLLESLGGQIL